MQRTAARGVMVRACIPRCLHRIRFKPSVPLRLSAMIRVAGQNGRGAINLFQKHDAYHLMRPGRSTEREPELCLAPQIGRKSVRSADQKKVLATNSSRQRPRCQTDAEIEREDVGGEVGTERAGRLVDEDEGLGPDEEKDMVGDDVGIDGAGASAEEAAVHIVDDE